MYKDDNNFGVTINHNYTVADAIEDDKLFREMKAGRTSPTNLIKMVAELTATISSIKEDTYFVKKVYTSAKTKTTNRKLTKEERAASLLQKITSRGKKL